MCVPAHLYACWTIYGQRTCIEASSRIYRRRQTLSKHNYLKGQSVINGSTLKNETWGWVILKSRCVQVVDMSNIKKKDRQSSAAQATGGRKKILGDACNRTKLVGWLAMKKRRLLYRLGWHCGDAEDRIMRAWKVGQNKRDTAHWTLQWGDNLWISAESGRSCTWGSISTFTTKVILNV